MQMRKKTLRAKLLTTIAAVSFAAIILCVTCFVLMLNNVKNDALRRGTETNTTLIDIVMHGFAQNEGNTMHYILKHVSLAMPEEEFTQDDDLLSYAHELLNNLMDGNYLPPYALFIARDGFITAVQYAEHSTDAPFGMSPNEIEQMIEEAELPEACGENFSDKLLVSKYAGGTIYNTNNEQFPMLLMTAAGENTVIGMFLPSSSGTGIYEALQGVADTAQEETAQAIGGIISKYTAILVGLSVSLLLVITWLSGRLSRTIAEPVEQEKAMLEQTSKMKTELLANISHEIKTPLTVISTHIQRAEAFQTLSGDGDKEKMLESLAIAQDEIMMLSRLITSALALASLQETSNQKKAVLEVPSILYISAEAYRPILEKQGNTLTLTVAEGLSPVFGNSDALSQMISNLISNANAHTKNGNIELTAAQSGDTLTVSVADNGKGILPELLEQVFERGVTDGSGSGLGLTICREIAKSHGGNISVSSTWGKGTEVTFTLPAHNEDIAYE